MSSSKQRWSDRQFELVVGSLLRWGVTLPALVVLVGGAIYLIRHGTQAPAYQVFRGEPAELRSLAGIFAEAAKLHGRGIIQLGVLLLVATPVARVMFSIFVFARQRDYLYIAVTLV